MKGGEVKGTNKRAPLSLKQHLTDWLWYSLKRNKETEKNSSSEYTASGTGHSLKNAALFISPKQKHNQKTENVLLPPADAMLVPCLIVTSTPPLCC